MRTRIVNHNFSPDWITELSKCEVFVFGSNLEGQHHGGAARIAYEKFGAEWGVGDGPTGRCYAIPTMHGGLKDIKPYVDRFLDYAETHPMQRFLLTRIGCGIAGFDEREMAQLFERALDIPNIAHPKNWGPYMLVNRSMDAMMGGIPPHVKVEQPHCINEKVLDKLCQKYLYQIGSGVRKNLPNITIRYVKEDKQFGYAKFGDFLQFGEMGGMFVWENDDKWKDYHNQEVAESTFEDECKDRGFFHFVLFAGVATPYRDVNGERIYTGDVIREFTEDGYERYEAVGCFSDEDGNGNYCFIGDNCCMFLDDALKEFKFERVGTVFYELYECDDDLVNWRTQRFNCMWGPNVDKKWELTKAKFTPNFAKEGWQYQELEEKGAELNWRK